MLAPFSDLLTGNYEDDFEVTTSLQDESQSSDDYSDEDDETIAVSGTLFSRDDGGNYNDVITLTI